MFRHYLTIARRNISRNKLYAVINVLGLSLGICACIVIWLVSSYELSFDTFHPDGDRIYRVGSKFRIFDNYDGDVPPPAPAAIRKEIAGVETVTGFFPYSGVPGAIIADPEWFSVFPHDWLAGSPTTSLLQPFSVVLTESRAHLYFGSLPLNSIIGKEVIYEDSLRVHVSGIVRDWKNNTDLPYTDFISFSTIQSSFLKDKRPLDSWRLAKGGGMFDWPWAFVKLSKGVPPAGIDARLKAMVARYIPAPPGYTDEFGMQLQPLTDIHFNSNYNDGLRKAHLPTLYALMGIAVFILLLATVNFINLATAQSIQRAKEIGVRKVLGSSKTSLVVQFLTEAAVLTVLAVLLAASLVKPVMGIFRDYIPDGVRFHPSDPVTLIFLVSIAVFTTLFAGFYPARILAGYQPVSSLKGAGEQKGGEKWWLRKSLIVFQFTISLVFILAVLIMGNQIRFMLDTDYGFRSDAIVTVQTDGRDTTGKINVLAEKFSRLPGIGEIVREGNVPIGWGYSAGSLTYKGQTITKQTATLDWGNEAYIPFYQMRIVAGRNLRHSDSLTEWVINETMARDLGFKTPSEAVGKFLYYGKRPFPIAGVVADFHQGSFREAIKPVAIGNRPVVENCLGIKLNGTGRQTSSVKATLAAMEKIFRQIYPGHEFSYRFMDESIAQLYEDEQQTASLVQIAMALAILISCMGLFGLALFTAIRRTKEIGIRKVLGARVSDIVAMLSRDYVILVILSLVIASPIAWLLMHQWLQNFAYHIPVNWWVFPLAGFAAIAIALLTVGAQAIRAAMANPVRSLHME
jgi:putative ABC transport system permease protein